jgi:AcrR family transcriptional regulator
MTTDEPAPSLRDRQRDATRDLILSTVARLMERTDLADLTFGDIGRASGISERTIYRHFPTKDELLEVFWTRMQERLGAARATAATGPEALWEGPMTTFPYLDKHEALIRGVIAAPQAAAARKKLREARRDQVRKAVLEAVGPLQEPALTHLSAVIQLLNAPVAWAAFKDDYGLSGAEAGRAASAAIKALIDAARTSAPQPSSKTKD